MHVTRLEQLFTSGNIFTPHVQHEWDKVIGIGVHIIYICRYIICLWAKKYFKSYFVDRLTISNIRGNTSRLIHRLALPQLSPEMLSLLSKSRIFLFNMHLALDRG